MNFILDSKPKWLHEDFLNDEKFESRTNFPLWRCFIKGVTDKHVLLTFIPASVRDLTLLNSPIQQNQSITNQNLILPIFVYDCSSTMLINSFINSPNHVEKKLKDIVEDRTCKGIKGVGYQDDCLKDTDECLKKANGDQDKIEGL